MFSKKEKITINTNNTEINKEKANKSESYEMVVRHVKRSALVGILASAIVIMIAAWSVMAPYAITVNGSTVCYVRNREAAGNVTNAIIKEYLPEDATMSVFDVSDNINVEAAGVKQALSADCVSVADAASMLKDRLENPDDYETAEVSGSPKKVNPFGIVLYVEAADGTTVKAPVDPSITVLSTANVTETFKVPTEYIKDDSMLAGDSEVEAKGNKGKREVLRQFTTVNGEVVKTDDLNVKVVKEAKPKVIRKGTLGLPEGEDWKTYEGDPIFNDGEVLISTAKKYLGAPYKYGGYSLTTGIDCVQFIRQMYAKYGIKLPNGKNALKHVGTAVSFANARPGDIICYSNHYALYMGNNTIIHATSKGGVKIRHNAKFRKIVTVRRIPRS